MQRHQAVGQTWAELARNLADSLIIPFKVQDYAKKLQQLIKQLEDDFGQLMKRNGIEFGNYIITHNLFCEPTEESEV